jgi:lysophospholipase L1-like esterase
VIKPENHLSTSPWGLTLTGLADTTRSNGKGALPLLSKGGVLAVGDSFTFGDQVADEDTWPAYFERDLGVPVRNGGVFGYGTDQTYLRAEDLLTHYQPDVIVFSLIEADIRRSENSESYQSPKPYFEIEGDSLVLKNQPVPRIALGQVIREYGWIRGVLGFSYVADTLFGNYAHDWWYRQRPGGWHTQVHSQGLDVSCRVAKKIAALARSKASRLIFLMQYEKNSVGGTSPEWENFRGCAQGTGAEVLDVGEALNEIKKGRPRIFDGLYREHMSPEGNHLIAELLAKVILQPGKRLSEDR